SDKSAVRTRWKYQNWKKCETEKDPERASETLYTNKHGFSSVNTNTTNLKAHLYLRSCVSNYDLQAA
ncbi:MAG TPA: hypothetical protein VIH42_07195, partial [Thermoguttaceae bacterium]